MPSARALALMHCTPLSEEAALTFAAAPGAAARVRATRGRISHAHTAAAAAAAASVEPPASRRRLSRAALQSRRPPLPASSLAPCAAETWRLDGSEPPAPRAAVALRWRD